MWLEAPRAGAWCRRRAEVSKRYRKPIDDEAARVVRYTCPRCKRAMEEVDGRRMWCILCRVRMVAERRRKGEQE